MRGDAAVISPLSGLHNCTLLKAINLRSLADRWQCEMGIYWQVPPGIEEMLYWRDEDTGLYFYTPSRLAGSADLYQQLQKLSWYYMPDKWEFRRAIQLLRLLQRDTLNSQMPSILEIGVGKGYFLEQASHAGFEVAGVELNPDAAAMAQRKGYRIFCSDLSALIDSDHQQWDVICSFQVLEHLSDPHTFLQQMLQLLKPEGFLLLSVPNAAVSIKLDPDRLDLLDQPPHHMTHWSEQTFRSLKSFFPLKVHSIEYEPLAPYHVDWFVGSWKQRLQRRVGIIPGALLLNPINHRLLYSLLSLGPRRFIRGHTLMACLQKTGER